MKLMIFKWEGNSYGISLDKLQSANNHIKNIKKIHPFFQDFKIPKKTKSLALKSGFFFPTQEMPKIEEVEIERNIDLPYLSEEKVIGCFNLLSNNKKVFGLILDDIRCDSSPRNEGALGKCFRKNAVDVYG